MNEINWNRRTYTKHEFVEAWQTSISIAECGRKLGLNVSGTTYTTLKNTALDLSLASDHMAGEAWRRGRSFPNSSKIPLEEILVEGSRYSTSTLRTRLLKEKVFDPRCSRCGGEEWNGLPMPLELDHINGVNDDHRIENLRILCPNCHAQTTTYRGKNKKKNRPSNYRKNPNRCFDCAKEVSQKSLRCRPCGFAYRARNKGGPDSSAPLRTKIVWPTASEVVERVNSTSFSATGRYLGVSDNAVRKFLKSSGVDVTQSPMVISTNTT